jgi:hypothetical protein
MKMRYFAFLECDAENCGCGVFVANFAASATEAEHDGGLQQGNAADQNL